jgi:hypothetical protein
MHTDHAPNVPVFGSHVRICIPQLPHACIVGPLHICPLQLPHLQVASQVSVPWFAQACVLPCLHTPSAVHAPYALHMPVLVLQVRDCVPQLPQVCVAAPLQVCPEHAPHAQLLLQVCLPPAPHVWVAPGAQLP